MIEELRMDLGLTIEGACAATGGALSPSTWWRIENEVSACPTPSHRAAIAEVFDVRVSEIWPVRSRYAGKANARWRANVEAESESIEQDGSLAERQAQSRRLYKVLEKIDLASRDGDADDGPYEKLWQLARSLAADPAKTPLTGPDGDSEIDHFTPVTRKRVIDAKHRRAREQRKRVKQHGVAVVGGTPPVSRTRSRERRETRRASRSSSSSDDEGSSDEPGEARHAQGRTK